MWKKSLCLLLCLIPVCSFSAPAAKTTEYTLNNGLRLIVREDHRAPVVLSSVWYRVGSSYEHNGITGISHMLEHMMFEGTAKYGPGEIDKMINDNGGEQNAMTSYDYTAYYQRWAADKLPLSFEIEADRMHNLQLRQARFEKEHQVVMEERRMRVDDNPQAKTFERFNALAYINNPYHHPIIGWPSDIANYKLANLKSWYHQWYGPNNAIVIVVGDVDPAHVYQLAKQYFGPLKKIHVPVLKPRKEMTALGIRETHVVLPAKLPWLVMGYNVPEITTAKEKWVPYALVVASAVLEAGDSARFSRVLVRKKQIAVEATAGYNPYYLHDGLFTMTAIPTSNHSLSDLKSAILQQVNLLKATQVSQAELNRIKAQVIADTVYQQDSLMSQAFDIGVPEIVGLSWKVSRDYVNAINRVTSQQVQMVAKRYFRTNNLTVATLQPKSQG